MPNKQDKTKAKEIFDRAVNDLQKADVDSLINAEAGFNFLLDRNEDSADLWFYVGAVAMKRGLWAVAKTLLQKNLDMDPKSVAGWNNMGFIYKQDNQEDKAEYAFRKAVSLFPKGADSVELGTMYNNIATLYVNSGTPQRAIKYCEKALEVDPDSSNAKWNMSLALLEMGQWRKGWEYHEAGSSLPNKRKVKDFGGVPVWDGTPDQTVVIYGEQGLGDEIMFCSMIPDMIRVCKKVIYDAHPRLVDMARESFPEVDVFGTRKDKEMSWPNLYEIDAKIAIGSLGKYFRNKDEDFPRTPYYRATPWIDQYRMRPGRLKVGIAWKGGYKSTRKDLRSLTLEQLKPILELDADFYSLQYTQHADIEVAEFCQETGLQVFHDQEMIDDYDRTAGFIQNLDVVVSVCTSIIHLCGALGVPCYVLTPSRPAWRYGIEGNMAWYGDHVQLIRQKGDDWDSVINTAKGEICRKLPASIKNVS